VEQENVPVWQGLLLGLQFPPEEQVTHAPFLQTFPVPQTFGVPSATLTGVRQTAVPVEHDTLPVWQGLLLGLQSLPSGQAPQIPLLQNFPVSQFFPLSAALHVPVEHELQAPQGVAQQIPEIQCPF
jgi:hypothetical protein